MKKRTRRKDARKTGPVSSARVPLAMRYVEYALGRARVNVDVIDANYRVRYMDPLWARRYGGDVLGKKCYRLFAGRGSVCPGCGIKKAMRTGKVVAYESTLPREQNKPIQVITVPFTDESGEMMVAEINVDIGQRKKAEEVLRRDKETLERLVAERSGRLVQIEKKLDQASRLAEIGTLAASVAHELRNPLAAIRTAVFNVRRKTGDRALASHLDNIDKKILQADRIINNLLVYSRISVPRLAAMNICTVIDECLETVQGRYRDHCVSIVKDFQGPCRMMGDPDQLREVFDNILNNACEALPGGRGTIEVTVRKGRAAAIRIDVCDTGIGIAPDDLAHIHEPFFSTKKIGTGLGLPICHKIVTLHNGRIDARSAIGKGTVVTVTLPRKTKLVEKSQ